MRKIVLAATLISCIALHALEQTEPPRGLQFTPQEWQELKSLSQCSEDQVIFRDGEKVCGLVESIPSLSFQFGSISFKIKDLSLIIFSPNDNKVQYITHDGSSFVGSPLTNDAKNAFKFTMEQEGIVAAAPLDSSRVKYIILKEREARLNPKNKLFTIELQNGDHMAVQLDSVPIRLSDGKNEFQVSPDEIVDLCFNGGVYGETCKGRLAFSYLKDHYLEVHLAWGNQTLRLPWEAISGIHRQENITFLDGEVKRQKVAKGSLLIIRPPESIFLENETFEKLTELIFEAEAMFLGEPSFNPYNVTFEEETLFEGPEQLFNSPDFFEKWKVAFGVEDGLTPEDLSHLHYDTLVAEPVTESFEGEDVDDLAFAEKDQIEVDSLDDTITLEEIPADSLEDGISLEIPDSMVYVPHEIHTLGEYTQKTHSLIRDKKLETTMLPTDQYPTLIVRMPGFFIDRQLVTNAEYAKFVQDTNRQYPEHWDGGFIPAGKERDPVVNVTYLDAMAYAKWMGKRVPTESEWIRAANHGVFNLDSPNLLREWTASKAYPSEGDEEDLVVIAPMMFHKRELALIPHSAPREVITIQNQNISNSHTGFRCVNDAQE